jgi:hypothetical protein
MDSGYMRMNAGCRIFRKSLLLTSLLVVLISSLFVGIFMTGANGASLENAIHVKNENELKNAINNAPTGKPTTITLDNDITLTSTTDDHNSNYHPVSIIIPADKDITLTSNKANGYYKLNSAVDGYTLFVASNAILRIDGIAVTHTNNAVGSGVSVDTSAEFYLYNGLISGNKGYNGHGVFNVGTFIMSGGEISDNTAENGGGVHNSGTFMMTGGTISNNKAHGMGGGVSHVMGVFTLSGGKITGNIAEYGGGIDIGYGEFTMSGGTISGNTATQFGGGVRNYGTFTISGGEISGNKATLGGGVYDDRSGGFDMRGGVVSGNTATTGECNDVYHSGSGGSSGGSGSGDGGSSNGNGGFWSGGSGGSSSGGVGFGLRDVVFVCVGVAVVVVGVVVAVLLFTFKKELNVQKARQTEVECICDGGC